MRWALVNKIYKINTNVLVLGDTVNRASDRLWKKIEIVRDFKGKLGGTNSRLCGKLCRIVQFCAKKYLVSHFLIRQTLNSFPTFFYSYALCLRTR